MVENATFVPDAPISALLAAAKKDLPKSILAEFPHNESLKRSIQRRRQVTGGKSIDNLKEFCWGDRFTKTKDGKRFLLYSDEIERGGYPTMIIFASDRGINVLRNFRYELK